MVRHPRLRDCADAFCPSRIGKKIAEYSGRKSVGEVAEMYGPPPDCKGEVGG